MTVYCLNEDCVYNDGIRCTRNCISVGENYENGCEDYKSYLYTKQYQDVFYKCVKTESGKIGALKSRGKRIEYDGYIFFTQNKEGEEMFVTDEKTGLSCGRFEKLKDPCFWKKFIKVREETVAVYKLPLAIEINGKCYLKEEADAIKKGAE